MLDIEIARADGDAEAERFAKERVSKACVDASLSGDIPLDTLERMIEIALDNAEGDREPASEAPEGTLEYNGEGLS